MRSEIGLPALIVAACFFVSLSGVAEAADTFELEVAATTMIQIVLQWENEPANTASFRVERATNAAFTQDQKNYTIAKEQHIFSDTDREPVSKIRFNGALYFGAPLDPATTYYYRIKANLDGGGSQYSNTVSAQVSGPVRGVEGDLWADIVLGKSHFGENVIGKPTKYATFFSGGVVIDKTVSPNRMYIADCNNNRVLGFTNLTPDQGADIVFGQPEFNSSAGNGDSSAQTFPHRVPAGASTLCLTLPTQISMGETIVKVQMALDEEGSLYVPDVFNNRILKYENPFGTDTIADQVWGQADFTGNEPNRGFDLPNNVRLRFTDAHQGALSFDSDGNMWVVDNGNHRVLRFPKDPGTGVIASGADIVLGQASFFTRTQGRTLSTMSYPRDAEFDHDGRLYVSDGINNFYDGRVIIFDPPFSSGMSATQEIPVPRDMDPYFGPGTVVDSMVRDKISNRMWFQKSSFTTELVDVEYGESISFVRYPQTSSADVDSDGNLYIVAKWSGTFRYPSSTWYMPWSERSTYVETVFPEGNAVTADTTGGIMGITTFGNQLLISDRARILIWNNYDINSIVSGQPADDVYNQADFTSMVAYGAHVSLQVDSQGRLWALKARYGVFTLKAFEYPLTNSSSSVKSITVRNGNPNVLDVKGGGGTSVALADSVDFAVEGSGDKIWIADQNMHRILRINNIDGLENPGSDPYVDIVLGQETITAGEINQGGSIGPQTLDKPYNVGISPDGDLYITDNGGEVGSNRRILRYNKDRFPNKPATVRFNSDIGDPDSVIGTGGSLYLNGLYSLDPMCCPFELGLHPQGTVVAGMNGYSAQRFPLVYIDPITDTLPQMALADFTSYSTTCFVDADGNVYMGDWDWYRVLVWKKPFKNIDDYFSVLDIKPIESTENVRVTWKSRESRNYAVYWSDDVPGPSMTWNPASGSEALQSGTGGTLGFIDNGITTYGAAARAPLSANVEKRYYEVREMRE